MPSLAMRKFSGGLMPVDQEGNGELEKIGMGVEVMVDVKRPRNIGLHRKFFALLDVAYDAWEAPELEYKGEKVGKDRCRFRHDITVMCGHYTASVNIRGDLRLDAKSISFAKMTEGEFEKLYSTAIDVILQKILTHYTRADLDRVVGQVLGFS